MMRRARPGSTRKASSMRRFNYSYRILRDFARFARENRVYWLVPLVVVLGMLSLLIVAIHALAPFVYTLF